MTNSVSLFSIAMPTIILLLFSAHDALGEEMASKTVTYEGKNYDIRYVDNGTVTDANVTGVTMFVSLDDATQGKGILVLNLPMALVKPLFGAGDSSQVAGTGMAVFLDDIDTPFTILNSTCKSLSVSIPVDQGAGQVEIAGSYIPSSFFKRAAPSAIAHVVPTLQVGGNNFAIHTLTNADDCLYTLDQEKKDLHVAIQSPNVTEGYMRLSIPHELLGGNYTVLIDGKATTDYNVTLIDSNTTALETRYSPSAKSIDIIGTSVIPEFPNTMAVLIGSVGLLALVALVKNLNAKQGNNEEC